MSHTFADDEQLGAAGHDAVDQTLLLQEVVDEGRPGAKLVHTWGVRIIAAVTEICYFNERTVHCIDNFSLIHNSGIFTTIGLK